MFREGLVLALVQGDQHGEGCGYAETLGRVCLPQMFRQELGVEFGYGRAGSLAAPYPSADA